MGSCNLCTRGREGGLEKTVGTPAKKLCAGDGKWGREQVEGSRETHRCQRQRDLQGTQKEADPVSRAAQRALRPPNSSFAEDEAGRGENGVVGSM